MNNLLIISCIFGKQFKKVHPSPDNKNSYFFTNNKELKGEIINKGWNYVYVNKVLSNATRYCKLNIIEYLIEKGANNFNEALLNAVLYDSKLNLVEYLIEEKVD